LRVVEKKKTGDFYAAKIVSYIDKSFDSALKSHWNSSSSPKSFHSKFCHVWPCSQEIFLRLA